MPYALCIPHPTSTIKESRSQNSELRFQVSGFRCQEKQPDNLNPVEDCVLSEAAAGNIETSTISNPRSTISNLKSRIIPLPICNKWQRSVLTQWRRSHLTRSSMRAELCCLLSFPMSHLFFSIRNPRSETRNLPYALCSLPFLLTTLQYFANHFTSYFLFPVSFPSGRRREHVHRRISVFWISSERPKPIALGYTMARSEPRCFFYCLLWCAWSNWHGCHGSPGSNSSEPFQEGFESLNRQL